MTGLRPVAKFPNTRYDALPEEHMAAKTPTVRDGVLYRQHEHEVYVDTPAWFAWLQEATTFAFRDDMGTFTARKERQRGGTYWRAYRKRDGVLRRCYLGRSPDLSRKHLEHAAQRLAEGDPPNQAHVPRTHGAHRDTRRAIPAPPTHLLPRPALLRRLDSDAWRVMLVSAPAGYGKTTLVGAWARTLLLRDEPCLWLALTQHDDANRLWLRLAQALDGHYPGVVPSGDMDADTLLGLLDSVPHTITVVLDDYDRAASRAVHAAIARVVGHAPSRLRLVLLCRADPPLPLHRWRAHGILAELRVPNLRFDDDEAAALVGAVRGSPPSPSALATIQSIAEGWPPVVRLVALAADDEAPSVLLPNLADYIAQDVWADLTPDMQRFVSATSVLDTLCEALCAAVTHADDAHMLLDRLARAQLLHPATGETHGWYRYHPLVAAWGREHLAQRDPHAPARALRTASAWCEQQDRPEQAITYALRAKADADAARLIAHHAARWLDGRGCSTLLGWLDRLPVAAIAASPRLRLVRMRAAMLAGRWDSIEATLRAAATGDEQTPETLLIRAAAALLGGQIMEASTLVERAAPLVAADDAVLLDFARMIRSAYAWASGDFAAAHRRFEVMRARGLAADDMEAALLARAHQAQAHWTQGHLHVAALGFGQVLTARGDLGLVSPAVRMASLGLARIYYERDERAAAQQLATDVFDHARVDDRASSLVGAALLLARIAYAENDVARAQTLIDHMARAAQRQAVQPVVYAAALGQAWWCLLHDDLDLAAAWLHELDEQPSIYLASLHMEAAVTRARIALAHAHTGEALDILARTRAIAHANGRGGSLVGVLALEATALGAQGRARHATRSMEQALALAAPEGYIRSFVDAGAATLALVKQTVATLPPSVYTQTLLAACPAHDPAPLRVERLTERESEVLRLVAAGLPNDEIARRLMLTVGTVKKHVSHLLQKLHARNRTEAVAFARRLHLL